MSRTASRRALLAVAVSTAASAAYPSWAYSRKARLAGDVIIVGGGTAGMAAALHAGLRGAKVIIVEKGDRLGGTLWQSGGQMSAAGTEAAARLGITDGCDSHFDDIMRLGEYRADPELVRLAVQQAAETVDWFDKSGVRWRDGHPVTATGHEPYSARRVFAPTDAGRALLEVMRKQLSAIQRSMVTMHATDAVELIQSGSGAIGGVVVRDRGNVRRELRAPKVFLTSGGATGNPGMYQRFNGTPEYRVPWWPLNTGGGHDMAIAAGGFVRGVDAYLPDIGTVPASREWPAAPLATANHYPQRRAPWEIFVNAEGRRFMREDQSSIDSREKSVASQAGHVYWALFDSHTAGRAPPFLTSSTGQAVSTEILETLAARYDTICRAETIEQLAESCGLPVEKLRETVHDYNAGQALGRDEFGRVHMPSKIVSAPFYAVMLRGASLLTFGGIAVNRSLQVIRSNGQAVPGLYAAGEILGAGSLMGRGYSSGMMVTPAISFGRVLGRSISRREQ